MVVGERSLGEMMKQISKQAGLSKDYTNHSIRAAAVTILDKSGFEARHIMSLSGHGSESSITRWREDMNFIFEWHPREINSYLQATV